LDGGVFKSKQMTKLNSYYEKYGYVVSTTMNDTKLKIELSHLDDDVILYEKVFTIYGYYEDQLDELVDDCVYMYEKKLNN